MAHQSLMALQSNIRVLPQAERLLDERETNPAALSVWLSSKSGNWLGGKIVSWKCC